MKNYRLLPSIWILFLLLAASVRLAAQVQTAPHSAERSFRDFPNAREWLQHRIELEKNAVYEAATEFDLQGFVDSEIAKGRKEINLPTGRFKVTPNNRVHLSLEGIHDTVINGNGFELVCTETTRAIDIRDCVNLVLKNMVIDYDPLPFTQGTITRLEEGGRSFVVRIHEGYNPAEMIDTHKAEIYEPESLALTRRRSSIYGHTIEVIDSEHFRVDLGGRSKIDDSYIGHYLVTDTKNIRRSQPHAILMTSNKNLELHDITVFASPTFSFLETTSEGTRFYRCRVDRRVNEFHKREVPRLWSGSADGFHSIASPFGPRLEQCVALHQSDDCLNVRGNYHIVIASEGNTLRVAAKRGMDIQPGDPVEVVAPNGQFAFMRPPLEVKDIRATTPAEVSAWEKKFNLKRPDIFEEIYELTFDIPYRLPEGTVIAATNRKGDGFMVLDGYFGFNRSRGLLIKASNGLIEGNHIEGSRISGILVSPELQWMESGFTANLAIRNNTLVDCTYAGIGGGTSSISAITIAAPTTERKMAPAGGHRNIEITNNRFVNLAKPVIALSSIDDCFVADNRYESITEDSRRIRDLKENRYWEDAARDMGRFIIQNCENLRIKDSLR